MKRCPECGLELSADAFWLDRRNATGLQAYCKTCQGKKNRAVRMRLRAEILSEYGGKCACCGERQEEFLAIDHIRGWGGRERVSIGGQAYMYPHIKKQGFPKDKYRILCHNCNQAMGFYGKCPHETHKEL